MVVELDADIETPDRVLEDVGGHVEKEEAVALVGEQKFVGFEKQCSPFVVSKAAQFVNILFNFCLLRDSRHLASVEKVSGQSALLLTHVWAFKMRRRIIWLSAGVQEVGRVARLPSRNNMD